MWEPATGRIYHTLTIPRGQAALAGGFASADARNSPCGLNAAIRPSASFQTRFSNTDAFEITVTINDDDNWSYDETITLQIKGQDKPFMHTDLNRLVRVGPPAPNPNNTPDDKPVR